MRWRDGDGERENEETWIESLGPDVPELSSQVYMGFRGWIIGLQHSSCLGVVMIRLPGLRPA